MHIWPFFMPSQKLNRTEMMVLVSINDYTEKQSKRSQPMTTWFAAFKAMIQQMLEPQQTLQPIKIKIEDQPQHPQQIQRRRRR